MIKALEPWLRAKLETISQKGELVEAIRYALSRWRRLARFLDDGRVDSNTFKRAIRHLALNRNSAFSLPPTEVARCGAVLASLIETCRLERFSNLQSRVGFQGGANRI